MTSRPTAPLRSLRAGVLAAVVLLLAAGAHASAGGALPSLPLMIAVGIPVGCLSVVLARRTRGPLALISVVAVSQVVLHEVFVSASAVPVAESGGHVGHHGAEVAPAMALQMAHGLSPLMGALHGAASLLTALLLVHGERLVTRLVGWTLARFARPFALPAIPSLRVVRHATARIIPTQTVALGSLSRRGPPARGAYAPVAVIA